MTLSFESLRSTDWALLDQMGSALLRDNNATPIEYRPLRGWPFAWLLHEKFVDGLTVADSTSLYRLQRAGLVSVVEWPDTQRVPGIQLTQRGLELVHRRLDGTGRHGGSALVGNSVDRKESGWH